MADISKITLPSGNTYDIKDEVARQMISGGVSFKSCTDASTTPEGVTWKRGTQTITGTLSAEAADPGSFYLVPLNDEDDNDVYAEYVSVGDAGSKQWERMGDTRAKISVTTAQVSKLKTAGSASNGSAASFTQGNDSFTANVPTTPAAIDTSKFSGGSFTQGTDTFTATVANETLTLGFSQGTDSFTAARLNSGFYSAGSKGSAATFTQGTDSFTANTPTSVTLPTFDSETVVKSIN